jgi:anti-sigma regulatory factor (Ser/Thr protein kinase)
MLTTVQPFTLFLWHSAIVYVLIHLVLSCIAYKNAKNRVFKAYAWYVGLVVTYLILRNYYTHNYKSSDILFQYAYYIQIIYLCVYIHFGNVFLKLSQYRPLLMKRVYGYLFVMGSIATLIFVAGSLEIFPVDTIYHFYFLIFFPIHGLLSVGLFIVLWKMPPLPQKKHFLAGSISYFLLGTLAILSSIWPPSWAWFAPMQLFYLALILECTFFALGLGRRLAMLYQDALKAERQRNEKELLESQLANLETKVLKSQINSHFLFNVLNAIKAFMIENKREQAIHYLNQFAKLIRRILEGSKNERHSLADEIQTLRWYLDIEKIRFLDPIAIEIHIERLEPLHSIEFPPLLLQPLVENALWHGLHASEGPKTLRIEVNEISEDIHIRIYDNGIGMEESKKRRAQNHHYPSMGMKLIKDRITHHNQHKATFMIEIHWEERKNPSGTLVTLIMRGARLKTY